VVLGVARRGIGQAQASARWSGSLSVRLSSIGCRSPRRAIAVPTQRGDQIRAACRSIPRSIASTALDSGAGLLKKLGVLMFICTADGWA
jgi:hypothetical protein